MTRPDIAHDVRVVSHFVSAPAIVYWGVVLRILKYLRGTKFQSFLFSSAPYLDLSSYCDADWNGDLNDRNPLLGDVFFLVIHLYHGIVRNKILHLDHREDEYHIMALNICEIIWLCWLLTDSGEA